MIVLGTSGPLDLNELSLPSISKKVPTKMVTCATCSNSKMDREQYDTFEGFGSNCPNCASNYCRKYYFTKNDPTQADLALRWAASIIGKAKIENQFSGKIQPNNEIRAWMQETTSHVSGVGKFVSHFGTTRMHFKNAANVMFQGQGKQITVDRRQQLESNGVVQDYFQFSFDHGNRMYAAYMRLLFPATVLRDLTNSDGPKEETLGDCVESCLGILRVALMYEDHSENIFGWEEINGVLTGLETSCHPF